MTALDWKVYKPGSEYTAATKHPSEAAMLVSTLGHGAQIKYRHHTLVWTEGRDNRQAAYSYDEVAKVCIDRVNAAKREAFEATQRRQKEKEAT